MMKTVKHSLHSNHLDDEALCNHYFRRYEPYKGIAFVKKIKQVQCSKSNFLFVKGFLTYNSFSFGRYMKGISLDLTVTYNRSRYFVFRFYMDSTFLLCFHVLTVCKGYPINLPILFTISKSIY